LPNAAIQSYKDTAFNFRDGDVLHVVSLCSVGSIRDFYGAAELFLSLRHANWKR
jgi:hypothetical protein